MPNIIFATTAAKQAQAAFAMPCARTERKGSVMAESVFKVIELVGTSETSISKAIDGAISKAGETVRQMGWFEVTQIRGRIEAGKVNSYQVTLKAGFRLED
jgi:dodecin